jgi:hypothetical protein
LGRHILERPGVPDRFLREIRAVARLRHDNIVAYSAFRLGESLVFAMEYVEGYDLSRLVKSRGPLPVAHACSFIHQAALGLQHAHEYGLVHRDIKPANLMLARKGNRPLIKVLDFGLSKATRESPLDGGLTHAGQMLGTPDYIAPEQTINAQGADIRADIYSLGCTLYYLLSGGPPFHGMNLYDILQAHHSMDAKPLNFVRPEVPAELAAVVDKMMAKGPARRFQTPGEVAEALAPFFKKGGAGIKGVKPEISLAGQSVARGEAGGAAPVPPGSTSPVVQTPPPMAEKSTVASRPESRWASLIGGRETEQSGDEVPAMVRFWRPPWVWPAVAAAVLFGFIALGIIITIRTRNGETRIAASDDKPFEADVDGIHIADKPSQTPPNGSTVVSSGGNLAPGAESAEAPGKRDRAYAPLFPGFYGVFMKNTRYSYNAMLIEIRCIGHNTIEKSQNYRAKVWVCSGYETSHMTQYRYCDA